MLNFKTIAKYAVAYTTWVTSFLLWVWFMFLARNAITSLLALYYYQEKWQRGKEIQAISQGWLFLSGLVWLILMIFVENYMRVGVKKHDFDRRIGKVLGPEIVLIFIADLALAFAVGLDKLPMLRWLVLLVELGVAVGLLWLGRNGLRRVQPGENANLG